jgi:NADPH:quinone reductase
MVCSSGAFHYRRRPSFLQETRDVSKVMRIHQHGGPEVLRWEDEEVGDPGPGQVRLRQTAVALNFVDIYFRVGQFGSETMPFVPGVEGAGIVDAVGPGVDQFQPGERVAYAGLPGAYREVRLAPAERLLKLPDDIDDRTAAAGLLRALTCEYLLRRLYKVQPGDTILFHAAAGGVGLIACQWAKALGATVIGTVRNDEKAEVARQHGCDHPIIYTREDFVARVKELTDGEGVPVVYDSVGRDTFMRSLECLRPVGMAINFGTASGQVEPFSLQVLHKKSLIVTRPALATFIAKRGDYETAAEAVFGAMRRGVFKVPVGGAYPLAEAAQAHRALESGNTIGSLVFTV